MIERIGGKTMKYYVEKQIISGVVFWVVERDGGHIERYCDTKERAEIVAKELNDRPNL
jgi:hypothetical protein